LPLHPNRATAVSDAPCLKPHFSPWHRIGIRKCHAFVFHSNPFGELFWERSGWQRRDGLYVFSKVLDLGNSQAAVQFTLFCFSV